MTLFSTGRREHHQDLLLGGTTAVVAGLVNVCSVMAFFAFASNVTGHVAVFAEELVKGHTHQIVIVSWWLVVFLLGAAVASYCVYLDGDSDRATRYLPLALETLVLAGVGYFGAAHYRETLRETELLVGILLFAMGMQNGLVSSISGGVVKTTHLTGLMTDLGTEIAALMVGRRDGALRFKLKLHLLILVAYLVGGIGGGLLFSLIGFATFYVGGGILFVVLLREAMRQAVPRAVRDSRPVYAVVQEPTSGRAERPST